MSAAACKEEENSRLAEAMCVLGEKCRLFESLMRQGYARDRMIQNARDIDAALQPALDRACEEYGKLNSKIVASTQVAPAPSESE